MAKYKRVTSNKMRYFGDIDDEKRVIRVNKRRSKSKDGKKKGGLIDTIVHEETHRLHPKMHEKTVIKATKRSVKRMSARQKKKNYSKFL